MKNLILLSLSLALNLSPTSFAAAAPVLSYDVEKIADDFSGSPSTPLSQRDDEGMKFLRAMNS